MKRRVKIKNSLPVSHSSVQDFDRKHFSAGNNVDNPTSGLVAETSGESLVSTSTNLNVPLIRGPSSSQTIANTTPPMRTDFYPPLATSIRPSEQILSDRSNTKYHGLLSLGITVLLS